MTSAKATGHNALFEDINITPLTDIFLVLLIIMMVVAPMMNQMRRDIAPPAVSDGAVLNQDWLTIEVASDGRYYAHNREISERDLPDILLAHGKSSEDKRLVIRADKATRSQAVLKLLELAQQAQFEDAIIAGESQASVSPQGSAKP